MEFHNDNGSEFINHVVTDWHRNPACPSFPKKSGQQFLSKTANRASLTKNRMLKIYRM
jgi:hypothetical protein